MPHSGFRFADESSSVIHAGITPPDDGSSLAMSASDFRVSTPTRACQESQLSMTSPSNSTMSPLAITKRPNNYLYGRPLNLVTGGGGSGQLNLASSEISSSCPSSTIKTNLPLPIHSDEITDGTGVEDSETDSTTNQNNGLPPSILLGINLTAMHSVLYNMFPRAMFLC